MDYLDFLVSEGLFTDEDLEDALIAVQDGHEDPFARRRRENRERDHAVQGGGGLTPSHSPSS